MEYIVNFLGGRRAIIEQRDYERLEHRIRRLGNMVFAPLADGSHVFYRNITWVHPKGIENDWEKSEYVVIFYDETRVALTAREFKAMTETKNLLTTVPVIKVGNKLMVRENIALICPHGSRLIGGEPTSEIKVEKNCCSSPVYEIRYVSTGKAKVYCYQCINCKWKSKYIRKEDIQNPEAALPVLE